jgi:hypothetical protein
MNPDEALAVQGNQQPGWRAASETTQSSPSSERSRPADSTVNWLRLVIPPAFAKPVTCDGGRHRDPTPIQTPWRDRRVVGETGNSV